MTGYALVDAFRHHAWATDRLLEFCAGLDDETLHAREVSTERDIREIFHHLIGSESYYRRLFAGSFLDWGWSDDVVPPMPQMRAWAVDLGAFWEKLLAGEVDGERIL
ncbi:MAG: DinB family protein, partial [Tepidiformaceae bacterium]